MVMQAVRTLLWIAVYRRNTLLHLFPLGYFTDPHASEAAMKYRQTSSMRHTK